MAITSEAFLYPVGKLQQQMFPGETLEDNLDMWITEAATKVTGVAEASQDTAAAFWVYYRAYDAIALRIGSQPSKETFGGNSGGGVQSSVDWGQNRADYWAELAQTALDNYRYYVPAVPPSRNVPIFQVF